ncbi:MAG: hypothetical protein M3Z31_11025 [Pseudomonadota bacterium]|nr:hypothetical protein [Pseudomonadota bacterium]
MKGQPFVGPAGKLLRRALSEAGIAPHDVYITNAVKHFSWEPRGKRRIHKTPGQRAVEACRYWLDGEIAMVTPRAIVALGATAAQSLLRRRVSVSAGRAAQDLRHASDTRVYATYHPAAVLRAANGEAQSLYRAMVEDLRRAAGEANSNAG